MQDVGIGAMGVDLIKCGFKVTGNAGTGLGDFSGAVVVSAHVLRGKRAVIQCLISHGNVHGNQMDVILLGQFGGNIGSGLSD